MLRSVNLIHASWEGEAKSKKSSRKKEKNSSHGLRSNTRQSMFQIQALQLSSFIIYCVLNRLKGDPIPVVNAPLFVKNKSQIQLNCQTFYQD